MYIHNEVWIEKAENANVRMRDIKATRGNIYSDNGSLMATSLPFYTLAFDPSISMRDEVRREIYEEGIDSLTMLLSKFFKDKSEEQYFRIMNNARGRGRQYLRLSSKLIDHHDKKVMSQWPIFREGQMMGGVLFEQIDKRFVPFGHLAGRTVGYCKREVKKDGKVHKIGAGLEYSFDSLLAGRDGRALFAKMSGGGWKQLHTEDEIKPIRGYDIESTIDVNLQDVVEETLLEALKSHSADYGSVVVMEAKTGEIKAIANLSRIKSGRHEGRYVENYNHAVGTNIEPGSTIKLATLMALFEETDLDLDDTISIGNGTARFYERTMSDDHASEPVLSIREVFENSSNVGIAKLAVKYFGKSIDEQQRFVDYLTDFGLKYPLNFQIAGEASPKIKTPADKSWSGVSLPWMSHGYGLAVSPLHILTMYNGIANDGQLIQPLIVKRIRYADQVVKEYKPEIINRNLCSDETLKKLKICLEGVVENGTARNIRTDRFKMAGKTGTAKKLKDGQYTNEYLASFVGYFPADNPKYSCIVVVDNPKNGQYYGNQVAAPVFRTIADKVYARDLELHEIPKLASAPKGIFPVVQAGKYSDLQYLCKELKLSNWGNDGYAELFVRASRNDELKTIKWQELETPQRTVPDVTGMTLRDALFILENLGMQVDFAGAGRVQKQSVPPGRKALIGGKIKIELG